MRAAHLGGTVVGGGQASQHRVCAPGGFDALIAFNNTAWRMYCRVAEVEVDEAGGRDGLVERRAEGLGAGQPVAVVVVGALGGGAVLGALRIARACGDPIAALLGERAAVRLRENGCARGAACAGASLVPLAGGRTGLRHSECRAGGVESARGALVESHKVPVAGAAPGRDGRDDARGGVVEGKLARDEDVDGKRLPKGQRRGGECEVCA
jgi:hypothetical protein